MRDIKFRGWDHEDDNWIYGGLYQKDQEVMICSYIVVDDFEFTSVVTSNVGQFTGLKDKNGVDIYEGDIVEYEGGVVQVKYTDGSFYVPTMNEFVYWDECEIIGNIHQNPELIK